jgi:hypothetical protein
MRHSFSFLLRLIALTTGMIFTWNQIVWAGEILPQGYPTGSLQPAQGISETRQAFSADVPTPPATSTDFLGQTLNLEKSAAQAISSKTVSSNPKLTVANVTTVPGSPFPYMTDGSSAGTDLSCNASSNRCLLKYDETNPAGISGFTVSFDNASTAGVETRNLSALANLTFGLKGAASSVTFEIIDSRGNKDTFILSGINVSEERFWRIPMASISRAIDKTRIKQLNFIVAQKDTAPASRNGTLAIRVKGLAVIAPAVPRVTSAVPLVTNKATVTLSGTKEANASILINGVEAVSRNGSTTWTAVVPLMIEGNNVLRISSRNSIGLLSVVKTVTVKKDTVAPSGSININSGAVYANSQSVTLNLSATDPASGVDKMNFSSDGTNWTVPVAYAASKAFTLPAGDGTKTIFVRFYDKAGNTSSAFSKDIELLTRGPVIVIDGATPVLINQKTLMIHYTSDGVSRQKDYTGLVEGLNILTITETGPSGIPTTVTREVMVDTIPPVIVIDAGTPTHVEEKILIVHYQVDGVAKTKSFVNLCEGENTLAIQETDAAGNQFVATWQVTAHLGQPVVIITSPSQTDQAIYQLAYTVDGEERTEMWSLQSGVNEILLRVSSGGSPSYVSRNVTLSVPEASLPPMPSVPSLSAELVSMTAQNGLVMKYDENLLVAMELPGEYTFYDPVLDASKNLVSGLLVFQNGDRLLYQEGRPVYTLSSAGEKTVYNPDGTVADFENKTGEKTRFAYQLDAGGKVTAILSFEPGTVSRYDAQMQPVWIKKTDGTQVYYEEAFLAGYVNASGDYFRYRITPQYEGQTITGHLSEIAAVRPAGNSGEIPFDSFLKEQENFPSAKNSLGTDLVRSIQYDRDGKISKAVSGRGESLELQNGLPTLFKDAAGKMLDIQSRISQNGDLFSVSFAQGGFEQIYDEVGGLSALRLSDGNLLHVTGSSLDTVTLEDESVLTQLVWNGQTLTGFRRKYADGRMELYQNSVIIERIDAAGNKTVFISDLGRQEAENVYTEDGKTYQVTRYEVSPGITERLTQLVKLDMPDGGRIEFEQGRPVRYIRQKQVELEPFEVPQLLAGQFFVPSIDLPEGKLRSLTVDPNGYIFSGEILFNDGTQYLIENNVIAKQISADGQFVEFSKENIPVLPKPAVAPAPLTVAEAAYRDQLVEAQLDYFTEGKGIHAGTGLPVDHYVSEGEKGSDYSQVTLVGFWAEILAAIARGDHQTSKMTQAQALQKLNALLENYQKVQQQAGWNGMVAFFKIVEKQVPILDASGVPTGQTRTVYNYENCFNQVGFGDALNLSVSLSSVIGALQGLSMEPALAVSRDQILSRANQILTAQEPGYAAFYDSAKKLFHGAYALDPHTGQWGFVKDYYMDRIFNEYRPGMAWLASRYPQYRDGFDNLDTTLRRYQTLDGQSLELAVPFDGGAFQMFWPLIHVDETQYADFDAALRNFLYAQAEFVKERGIPGLLSAGDHPGYGYEGKIGDPEAAEADDLKYDDIGSIYGTASAFGLAPHYTLQFLKNLETAFPQIRTNAGFVDAIKMENVLETDPVTGLAVTVQKPSFSSQYYGVDQASFILSLLRTSQTYFSNYLSGQDLRGSFDALYNSVHLNLSPAENSYPDAPEFGEKVKLYEGSDPMPDGEAAGLVKQAAFVSTVWDSKLGEGHVFNYHKADGSFHHTEIEFGEGAELKRMALQEYLMSSDRAELGRSLFEGFELDLYNRAASQGVFYDTDHGYVSSALTRDPVIGEVRHVGFDYKDPDHAVGLWNKYENPPLDLSQYDFLSIPVRVDDDTPGAVRVKFEFKGSGNVFITDTLKQGWQYITIPIVKPAEGAIYEIGTVIQPVDGKPLKGEIYLGPLSVFKVRTSNQLDWEMLLGRSSGEMAELIQKGIAKQAYGGGMTLAEEVLENFTIDSKGQLLKGVLKRADGSVQYFDKGQLVKWVFRNGRTVLYEKGIASFVVDLSRGKLETARFYYDQDLKGTVHSFNLQDNQSKRIFGQDGQLQSLARDGYSVSYSGGNMTSIKTSQGTFTDVEFGSDGSLLRAHFVFKDGRILEVDEQFGTYADLGGGTKIFYRGTTILGIETAQNGRTDFTYRYDAADRVIGVDATFPESGQPRTMSLFEYVQRPERSAEKAQIISKVLNLFSMGDAGGFSVGNLPAGEFTSASEGDFGDGSHAKYTFLYQSMNPVTLGMCVNHLASPVSLSDYGFVSITLKQDPSMTWNQDFSLNLKARSYNVLYSFEVNNANPDYQTFWLPLAGKSGSEAETTLEVRREQEGLGKLGAVFIKDLSYMSVRTLDRPVWETEAGISLAELQNLKIESGNLTAVGIEIAQKKPLIFKELTPYQDIPTCFVHTDTATEQNKLSNFRRFDGTQIELNGSDVKRMVLPDGTVNEYVPSPGTTQSTAQTMTTAAGSVSYNYGSLRRITQTDGRQYDLSYEFCGSTASAAFCGEGDDGKEITVFKDVQSGEERRFNDGKLLTAADPDGLTTNYSYANGEMIGAELTYNNRVLNSTRYVYDGEETQVTDERGTTWFYDANGMLIKHLTKNGLLYEYSEYSQPVPEGQTVDPNDYKSALYALAGLKAVSLKGYQAPDGSWIAFEGTKGSEVHLASGAQAANLEFDEDQRIRSGQIQFPDGLILEIENYIPARGRFASGQTFAYTIPQASDHEILQDPSGGYLGFRFKIEDRLFTYNAAGELIRAESGAGVSDAFTYTKDAQGKITGYADVERRQLSFNGVPFPKECELNASSGQQKLFDSGVEIATHSGHGFLVSVFKETTNQWDVYAGTFASEADKAGLKSFLSGIKAGEYVAVSVSDPSFSAIGEEILALFEGLGAGQIRQAATANRAWTFFGNERLSAGQGSERSGQASFSTVSVTSMSRAVPSGEQPVFKNAPMAIGFSSAVYQAYDGFLRSYQPLKLAKDLQRITVYNEKDEIVYTRRLDGISSFYELGKVRETFGKSGELLTVHEYECSGAGGCATSGDMELSKITLVKARQDFEAQVRKATEQIEQAKFDALYRLAAQDEVARLQIKENVDLGVAQISAQISSLESQRFQTVKQCRRVLLWKTCKEYTFEVPGVQDSINQLVSRRAELIQTGQAQLAAIPGAMLAKKIELEQATAAKMAELEQQKSGFLLDILRQEMEPIVTDLYRGVLGRDPSKQEFEERVAFAKAAGRIDIQALRSELQNSSERAAREGQKAAIILGVRTFLESYLNAAPESRAQMLQGLSLSATEAVALNAADVSGILDWLGSRDMHFGQSAFLSLKRMLASRGVEVSIEDLGKQTILIDILTGVIHKFSEGDLLISMFALDRAALIHGKDFASVKFSYEDLLSMYQASCGLQPGVCELRVIAHIGEDHFVVLKRVTDSEVIYEETNKGATGEEVSISKDAFLKLWIAKDNAGYLMVSEEQAVPEKKISDGEAMKIRGAFFFIFIIVAAVLSFASMVASVFSPTLGKILGYAALVAGIVGIVACLGQIVVQGLQMAFTQIGQQGFLATIKQGMAYVGKIIVQSVRYVGRFIQNGFSFLKDCFTGGLSGFGSGISDIGNFLIKGAGNAIYKDGVLIGHQFTYAQQAARQLVAAGLSLGVSKGLSGLGLSPQLVQLAGAFVGGGCLGIGSVTSSFIRSGLHQMALQGVSQMAAHIGLAPPITDALFLAASAGIGAFFDPVLTLKSALLEVAPTIATKLTMGGLDLLGRSLGLDPRLTRLLGLPISAIVGNITARFSGPVYGYDEDGNKIIISNPYDTGSLWDSIKNSLANGIRQVGLSFAGATTSPLFGSLLSEDILSSIAGTLNAGNLFTGILDILKTAVLAPFNAVSNILQTAFQGLRDFTDLIKEKGFLGALESLASAIFSRNTLEKILDLGGISHLLNVNPKILTTLANGQQGFEQKLDGSTSLFFDMMGNFVGKKENGVTQLGTFGVNSAGKWALLAGTFFADMVSGWAFSGEVSNGQLKRGKLYANGTVVGEFLPSENDGTIVIDGSNPDAEQYDSQAGFWGMVFKFLPYAMNFVFSNGLLQRVDVQANPGNGQIGETDQNFYVLANGINNVSGNIPDYIRNLEYDLFQQSSQEVVPGQDTLPISLYHPTTGNDQADGGIDALKWALESQSSKFHWALVMDVMRQLAGSVAAKVRPTIAMGYSGGLLPLVEGIAAGPYNVHSIVGLGAATLSLASSDMIDVVLNLVDFAQSSIGKVLGWLTCALNASLRFLLGKLHLEMLNVGYLADELVDLISKGSSLAIDKLREIVAKLPKIPAWNFPTLADRGTEAFVNIYGTKDMLYEVGISGYRDSLFGFSVDNKDLPLFNVEIKGAEHLDYMKRDDLSDPEWNIIVSDFVTRLMLKTGSASAVSNFFKYPPPEYAGCFSYENQRWVIRLPGWQAREQA